MDKLKLPDFKSLKEAKEIITRTDVRLMHQNLQSKKLDAIKNHSLIYAIGRTLDKLKAVDKEMAPEKVIVGWEEYNEKLRELHEKLSGGKTTETHDGQKIWQINYSSNEYAKATKALREEYGIDQYEEWMNGAFDENIADFIHYVNDKEVSVEKDVPDFGVYKLIKFMFKDK